MPAVNLPFGDLNALEDCLKTREVCAFFIEPIQGEGGIRFHPQGYLKAARELCTRYGTYLVCDEIQTGLGRTGKMWACQHEEVVPDVIVFAKGFSGGFVQLAGYLCTDEVWNAAYGQPETCFHHTVTFGESPSPAPPASPRCSISSTTTSSARRRARVSSCWPGSGASPQNTRVSSRKSAAAG